MFLPLTLFGPGGALIAEVAILGDTVANVGFTQDKFANEVTANTWENFEVDLNFTAGITSVLVSGNLLESRPFFESAASLNGILFGLQSDSPTSAFFVDDLTVSVPDAIPEPAIFAMFASGFVATELVRRRQLRVTSRSAAATR